MEQGFQYVKAKLSGITTEPGCYLMKDQDGIIFYIGKAKNLRARLKSYFLGTDTRIFVQYLENILADIEIIVVHNDTEALILERELIKKYDPRFNIQLRDDKNYILLKLKKPKPGKKRDLYPKLEIVRKTKKDQARYFGPYPSANKLRMTVDLINKYFMLRTCPDQVIDQRIRPCIQYQIGRCFAPCVYDVTAYAEELDNTALFLSGHNQEIKKRLENKMWALSENEQFEAAAKVRDQLDAIKVSLKKQVISELNRKRDQDIIGFYREGPRVEIVKLHVRLGSFQESHNYSFNDQVFPSEEILRSFMIQAYGENVPIPQDILLSLPIADELSSLKDLLEQKSGRILNISCPKKGKLKKLVELADKNAQTALNEINKQKDANEKALQALREKLGLSLTPVRIECVDISLIQGSEPFGSQVVFINGMPDKSKYRLHKIKSVVGMDDFSMIYEVVYRRIKRGITEGNLPDLLLIDGGKGQLNAALRAIEDNNLLVNKDTFYVAGIAKARVLKENKISVEHSSERLFVPGESEPIMLEPHTFERYLIERIRDEAHRFAITAHRRARKNRTIKSELLEIPGIGKKRALTLLRHFKSVKALKEASAEEICQVLKLSEPKAQVILEAIFKLNQKPSAPFSG
jgi:excinuclease ABC subunit C